MRRLLSPVVGPAVAVGLMAVLAGCVVPPPGATGGARLTEVSFGQLPGWAAAHPAQALPAFVHGCAVLASQPLDQSVGGSGEAAALGGKAGQWNQACSDARALPVGDDAAARAFFERDFQPFALGQGLITGYYEPQVQGSRRRGGAYQVPLLGLPDDLVRADLGQFDPDLKGKHITGRVVGQEFVPYYDRSEIDAGALIPQHLERLWLTDWTDAFFLQIQGSGRVVLPNGGVVRVTYAGQNGRPYVALGKLLADRGQIPRDQVSMQTIRAWLDAHPDQARALMDENPSYVFFKEVSGLGPDDGPPGALGASLTPGESLAVDPSIVPLGAPVWLDTTEPGGTAPLQRLMVAQDTGGAIRGQGRADIFFGWGTQAESDAGRMQQQGRSYVLLPKAVAASPRPAS